MIRGVAQFGSASALGAEGRRFESCYPDSGCHFSTGVVQFTCNEQVVGSNPTGGFHGPIV